MKYSSLLLCLLVSAFTACSTANQPSNSSDTVKVGVILPLSGPLAEYGEAINNAITLAEEDLGESHLEFVYEDSAYDAKTALSAFRKLRNIDDVQIIYNFGDPTSDAIGSVLPDDDVPFLAITGQTGFIEKTENSMRASNSFADLAGATWQYLRSKGYSKIAIVKTQNTYLNGWVDGMIAEKKSSETVDVIENYLSITDDDFRTSLTKIKSSAEGYDAIGVYLMSGQVSQFYKQMREMGMEFPTFGTDFFESKTEITAAKGTMEGAVFANHVVDSSFVKRYEEQFGNQSQIGFAGNTYDIVKILDGLDHSSRETITQGLQSIKNYEGVLGTYQFRDLGSDRYFSTPIKMKEVREGEIVVVE